MYWNDYRRRNKGCFGWEKGVGHFGADVTSAQELNGCAVQRLDEVTAERVGRSCEEAAAKFRVTFGLTHATRVIAGVVGYAAGIYCKRVN